MVVGAFPIAKLVSLAVKQISKPIATSLKNGAKRHPFFRDYICMPPAQFYHWIEVNVKMRMLNLGKPTEVPKLNEAMAIELGAELLGEGIIFTVAAACLIAEYIRSSKKEHEKEAKRETRFQDLKETVVNLEFRLAEQDAKIRELNRLSYGMHTSISNLQTTNTSVQQNNDGSVTSSELPLSTTKHTVDVPDNVISKALADVNKTLGGGHS